MANSPARTAAFSDRVANGREDGANLRRPVFIDACGRSGTTLVQNIVSSHPDIEILRRDQPWWKHFFGAARYKNLDHDPLVLQRLLNDIFESPTLRNLKIPIDREQLEARLLCLKPVTFADIFEAILEQNARNHNKPRWGLKTPGNETAADSIFAAHPNALMVHVIRDPRDVLASLQGGSRWWRNAVSHMMHWRHSVQLAERNLRRYSPAYYVMHYEDLVRRPEHSIRDLFEFLGIEFATEILPTGSFGQNSSFTDVKPTGITKSPAGRYAKKLTPINMPYAI